MTDQPDDTYNDDDDDLDNIDDQDTPPDRQTKKPNWRRDLEKDAKAGKAAAAERDAARRELAFLKAGIDLETPTGKLFAKAYDGANDVDAVKAAATEYGVINVTPTAPDVDPDIATEIAAMDKVSGMGAGAQSTSEESMALSRVATAESQEDVMAVIRDLGIPVTDEAAGSFRSLV